MNLPLSEREASALIVLEASPSTNSELMSRAIGDDLLPDFTVLVTDDQTAGRGRLGRVWAAPAGTGLAISVLVRTATPSGRFAPPDAIGWLPLAAGIAMTDAVAARVPGAPVGFKWPNDVQIDGRKVCGILSEVVPGGVGKASAVVIGAGLNLTMTAAQLPVAIATSLVIEGADADTDLGDRVLSIYVRRLRELVGAFWSANCDADASGLRAAAVERCTTLGREVRAELPGDEELLGSAVGIDELGRLQIRSGSGRVDAVAAGDIIHLR